VPARSFSERRSYDRVRSGRRAGCLPRSSAASTPTPSARRKNLPTQAVSEEFGMRWVAPQADFPFQIARQETSFVQLIDRVEAGNLAAVD